MANKDTIKQFFQTHDYPTQEQFWLMLDELRWKDEQLEISNVNGLQTAINNAASSGGGGIVSKETFVIDGSFKKEYTIPEGVCITQFYLFPSADCSPICTYQAVGDDTYLTIDAGDITAVAGFIWSGSIMGVAGRKIVVDHLPVGSTVVFTKTNIR